MVMFAYTVRPPLRCRTQCQDQVIKTVQMFLELSFVALHSLNTVLPQDKLEQAEPTAAQRLSMLKSQHASYTGENTGVKEK